MIGSDFIVAAFEHRLYRMAHCILRKKGAKTGSRPLRREKMMNMVEVAKINCIKQCVIMNASFFVQNILINNEIDYKLL